MNAIHRLTQYCLSLALAGACALPSRAAAEPAAAPPAGWEDCEVAEYREETVPAGARATAGDKVERWVLRSSRVPGAVYAVKRTVRGRKEISMCAYSPNRVLATLGAGQDYASFVEAMAAKGLKVVRLLMEDLDGNPVYVVESENTETDLVDQMTMSIEETGMCGTVAPDHIYEAEAVPNDPDWAAQWGLEKIGAPQAWETRTDASSVLVAVLDTGINHDHFDLNRNLWTNPGEIPGDGVDNDGNGVVDDVFGVACIGGNARAATMDDNGHGTHCAGIIGAVGNNWRNGAGVAWSAKIMSLKFLNGEGRGAVSDAITCLRYAAEQGVRVVNCSFGSADWDDYLFAQMAKMGKAGTVFACAAGNARNGQSPRDNDVFPFYPANFQVDNLVAVAASDPEDRLANFSYYGAANVDIAAPGTDIRSTVLGTYGMDAKSGTSMATPHVAGALALLMAEYPEEDAGRITERLYAAAEPVAALSGKVRTGARLSMAGFFGIAPPTEVSATQGTVQDAVVLYWTAAKDATHYRVWRADSEDGEKTMLCDWRQGLTYGDTEAEPGVTNWYFLQAARSASGDKASVFSAGVPGFRPAPDDRHVTVSFDAAGGTVDRTSALYEIGAPYGSFPAAQRDGMAFLGWHTAAEGGARVDESCVADADTTALHAHWIDGEALRVERLFARQRYPWNGLVDVTFELAGVPAGEFASVAREGNWTEDGGEGADAAPVPLATWEAGRPAGLGNGEHHGVWNADADAGAGAFGELALRAAASVDVPPPPAEGTAEDNPAEGVIDLSWNAARGATSYAVSRADRDDRAAAAPAAEVEGTSWRDTGAEAGNVYHYWIQSASSGGTSEGALHLWARRGLIPVSLEIGGPGEVDAGTTVQYSATAVLNDGSSVAVADAAAWSVASGGGLVAFVGPGTLVAAGTPAGGDAVVRAVFETNGVSATAEKTVAVRTVTVRVAFDGNGGTADPAERTYTAYGAYGELAEASRTGYAFGGWFTEPDGGSRVAGTDTVPAEGLTLYAHWTANTYTVKFDANGGTGTMEDQSMTYDAAAALRANAFTRTGYTFAGWATSASGAVAYADGASVKNLASAQGATVTLYAVWTANTYTVKFAANGGTGTMADQAMTYDTAATLRTNAFTRTGYTFAGWATSVDPVTTKGAKYALCTGLNKYASSYLSGNDLTGCVPDARNVYTNILLRGEWAEANTTIFTNAQGTFAAVSNKLMSLASTAVSGDVVLYYHSSHGYQESGKDVGICMYDKDMPDTSFAKILANFKAGVKVIIVLDACHTGGMFKSLRRDGSVRTLNTGSPFAFAQRVNEELAAIRAAEAARGIRAAKLAVSDCAWITATDYNQYSWDGDDGGAFTKCFVGSVKSGDCDKSPYGNGDSYATFMEMFDYAVAQDETHGDGKPGSEDYTMPQCTNTAVLAAVTFGWVGNEAPSGIRSAPTPAQTAAAARGTVAYADGESVVNLASEQGATVTLYAVWTANAYTVKFDANGGTGTMADQPMTYDQSAVLRANAFSRTGYTFAGWATSAGGAVAYADGESVENLASGQGATVTLYAVWTANTYTVRFNANGGTGAMADQAMTYDQTTSLRANAFARTGYTFAGWATSSGGGVSYADGAGVKNLASAQGAVVTLYAVWRANTYYVRFNANGGSGSMSDQTLTYNAAAALSANAFTKNNNAFMGWSSTSSGNVAWADRAVVTNLASAQGAVVQMYAVWLAPPATVTASDATSTDAVTVTWTAASRAASYEVWRGTSTSSGSATRLATGLTGTSYSDTSAVAGTVYYYWVKSVGGGVTSGFGGYDAGRRMVAAPTGVKATVSGLTTFNISWTASAGATKYEVWRTLSGTSTRVATVTAASWSDAPDLSGNKAYRYQVKAVSATDTSALSRYVEVRTYKTAGSYTLAIPSAGNCQIAAVGGGGGGGFCADPTITYGYLTGGGSGGAFQGYLNLAAGSYTVTVGGGGAGKGSVYVVTATGDNGGATSLSGSSTVFTVGGGKGGKSVYTGVTAGAGGAAASGSAISSTSLNKAGAAGKTAMQTTQVLSNAAGGASVLGGYGAGGSSGGGGPQAGGAGFFQIVFVQ
jgi:uncharacterized repeat protein (TIGR02543 family)